MAGTYREGIPEYRSGVFQRFSAEAVATPDLLDGRVAVVVQSPWGLTDKVTHLTSPTQIEQTFGTGATTEVINRVFDGGASEVFAIRLDGEDAKKGSLTLETSSGEDEPKTGGSVNLELICPGTRELSLQVKAGLGDNSFKTITVIEDGKALEELYIPTGEGIDEVEALIEGSLNSSYFRVSDEGNHDETTTIDPIATISFTGGVDPTVTTESYSNAFIELEKYRVNTLALDTVDMDVITLAQEYVNRLYDNGKYVILVAGTEENDPLGKRIETARSLNDRNVVLLGPGYVNARGEKIDGAQIAAQIAGIVAATPSSRSTTHAPIIGAVSLIDTYSSDDYKAANLGGLVTLSVDDDNQIVLERGVTTLTTLDPEIEDEGWKKIKRLKTRNELFFRVSKKLSPLVRDTTPDKDGIEYLRGQATDVLKLMNSEKKIADDYSIELTDEITGADKVSFVIRVYDYDTLEEIYLHYVFRHVQ